jgi:hypothetical protein
VRGHDPLGFAGAAGGIDQAGQIDVNCGAGRAGWGIDLQQLRKACDSAIRRWSLPLTPSLSPRGEGGTSRRWSLPLAPFLSPRGERGMCGKLGCSLAAQDRKVGGGDGIEQVLHLFAMACQSEQPDGGTVVEDVGQLAGLGGGVDDGEGGASLEDAKDGDHCLDRVGQPHRHPIPTPYAQIQQSVRHLVGLFLDLRIAKSTAIADQSDLVRESLRTILQKIVHQHRASPISSRLGVATGSNCSGEISCSATRATGVSPRGDNTILARFYSTGKRLVYSDGNPRKWLEAAGQVRMPGSWIGSEGG